MNDNEVRLIEQLAAKLGTTADHVWAVLVRQAPIEAFTDLFYVGLIAASFFAVRAFWRIAYKKGSSYDGEIWIIPGVIAWGAWAIFSVIVLIVCAELPTLFLNPEYWALNRVLATVGHK